MAVESATFISQLDATNPAGGAPKSEGDNHLRLLKAVLQAQFPNLSAAAVTMTAAQLNSIPLLATLLSPVFTGNPRAPTQSASDSSDLLATTMMVQAAIGASAIAAGYIPSSVGNDGKVLAASGGGAAWAYPWTPEIHVREEQSSGNSSGSSSATTNNVRTLNTVVRNTLTGASLASNRVTLPAGTYHVFAFSPYAGSVGSCRAHLWNHTDSSVLVLGTVATSAGTQTAQSALVLGTFTLAAQKEVSLRLYTQSGGVALGSPASDGNAEVYSQLWIRRIG